MNVIRGAIRSERGTSLVEMLTVSAMLVVVLSAVLAVMDTAFTSYTHQTTLISLQTDVREANQRLVREIRQAESPLVTVSRFSGNEVLTFSADIDNDLGSETIQYMVYSPVAGQKIIGRRVKEPGFSDYGEARVIANNVINSESEYVFVYYGTNLSTPLQPGVPADNILTLTRIIKIRIRMDNDLTEAPGAVETETYVKLRNFTY